MLWAEGHGAATAGLWLDVVGSACVPLPPSGVLLLLSPWEEVQLIGCRRRPSCPYPAGLRLTGGAERRGQLPTKAADMRDKTGSSMFPSDHRRKPHSSAETFKSLCFGVKLSTHSEANIGLYLQVKHVRYVTLHIGSLFSGLTFSRKTSSRRRLSLITFLLYFTIISANTQYSFVNLQRVENTQYGRGRGPH